MEETNYHRKQPRGDKANVDTGRDSSTGLPQASAEAIEKSNTEVLSDNFCVADTKGIFKNYKKKSYWTKLKVFDKEVLRYPNHLKGMFLRPLIFLKFPVVVYSGFSYGSNLIWFNVLNGTTSLILSEKPYSFSSSIVGLCYVSPLIGVILG